jgi:hypothetical protein
MCPIIVRHICNLRVSQSGVKDTTKVHKMCDQIPPEYISVYTPIAVEFVYLTHQQHDTDRSAQQGGRFVAVLTQAVCK